MEGKEREIWRKKGGRREEEKRERSLIQQQMIQSDPYLVINVCDVHYIEHFIVEVATQYTTQDIKGDVRSAKLLLQ